MTSVNVNGSPSTVGTASGQPDKHPPSMVERMTLILDAFDGRAARLTLEQVVWRTELPRSTVHRILDQLIKLDWIDHASFGYCLGRRALGLGGGGHSHIREAAAPLLHELYLQTGLVVHLSVLDGRESVYLDKVGGRFAAAIPSRVGGRVLAHSTASGKAMLAWIDAERVDAIFGSTLPRCTESTITDITVLHLELNRIRQRRGLAFERGESAPEIACVASAIRGHEGPLGSIALCGDIRTAQLERVAPLVVDTARQVSNMLYPEMKAPCRARKSPATPKETFSSETMDRLLAMPSDRWM